MFEGLIVYEYECICLMIEILVVDFFDVSFFERVVIFVGMRDYCIMNEVFELVFVKCVVFIWFYEIYFGY